MIVIWTKFPQGRPPEVLSFGGLIRSRPGARPRVGVGYRLGWPRHTDGFSVLTGYGLYF